MLHLYDDNRTWISGYRAMWSFVMFDLPTKEKEERQAYVDFRHFLLDQGYTMAQFSIYMRLYPSKEAIQSFAKRLEKNIPSSGSVQMIAITDKQYENIVSFRNQAKKKNKNPDQYVLF